MTSPDTGTPPGGGIAPRGVACIFADDGILGCALEADARRVMEVLPKRWARFRRTLHPAQTALMACQRPPSRAPSGGGQGRVALRGLTHYGATTRSGYGVIKRKTGGKRLRRVDASAMWPWCRDHRHAPLPGAVAGLGRETARPLPTTDGIRGHFNDARSGLRVIPSELGNTGGADACHKGHLNWQKCGGRLSSATAAATPQDHAPHRGQARDSKVRRQAGCRLLGAPLAARLWLPRNRRRATFTSGSVGIAPSKHGGIQWHGKRHLTKA